MYACHHCMERIGVRLSGDWWRRNNGPWVEDRVWVEPNSWCRDCWIRWFEDRFHQQEASQVVTVDVKFKSQDEDCLEVTCTTLAGLEVLKLVGLDCCSACVSDIKQKVAHKLPPCPELRLLHNGRFYSSEEFEKWALSFDDCVVPFPRREVGSDCGKGFGLRREGKGAPPGKMDMNMVSRLHKDEAHWRNVWSAAPQLLRRPTLCTSGGRFLELEDDTLLLKDLALEAQHQEALANQA